MNHYWQSLNRQGQHLKISAIFQENTLDLTVLENETAWNAHISKNELTTQSKNNLAEYYENLRKYFECCPEHVLFHFMDGKFTINLLLKNKMKQLYFYAVLNKVNFVHSIFQLTDTFYSKNVDYSKELDDVKMQVAFLTKANETLERKINEFLDRRQDEELKTYNNFIAILNEKKRQILHLNELLIAFRQGRSTVNPPVQLKRKRESKTSQKNKKNVRVPTPPSSGSNSDTEYDTDQEIMNNKPVDDNDIVLGEVHNTSPVPTTSKIEDEYESPTELSSKPFVFPKRIHAEDTSKTEIVLPKKDCMKEQDVENGSTDNKYNQNIPLVDFNTQDLLDNL